ncbi:MAG: SDR family NAD(P)-dependent oxidoreductase [Polyangiaceae bacterium]
MSPSEPHAHASRSSGSPEEGTRSPGLLEGKVVVITGAGSGIGRAEALAAAGEGACVVVNDVGDPTTNDGASPNAERVVSEIKAAGGKAAAFIGSVAERATAEKLIAFAVSHFGRVDGLVNNAGIVRDKSFLKMEEAMWNEVLSVQLHGTFFVSQAFTRQVLAQAGKDGHVGGGRIVNTTSVSGLLGNFGQANYAAANAGIYGLTRTMSIELQKHRMTVNALAPIAKTAMTQDMPMFHNVTSMTPEHVAPATLFLLSDLCGDKTGHILAVAGSRMYAFKLVETAGRFKEGESTYWTPEEIAEHWDSIVK